MRALLRRSPLEWRVAAFMMAAGVVYLSLLPSPPPTFTTGWDKLNHALAFAALAWAGRNAFPGTRALNAVVAASLVAFGAAIEAAQHFIPGRSCEAADLIADCFGIAAGLLFGAWMARVRSLSVPSLPLTPPLEIQAPATKVDKGREAGGAR